LSNSLAPGRLLCWLLVSSCLWSGSEDAPADAALSETPDPAVLELGWFAEVGAYPTTFATLTEGSKAGWVALHANDYDTAIDAFASDPVGRGRASLALAVLYDDLSRYSGLANELFFSTWAARGTLPAGNEAPMVAALAAHCGEGETVGAWASKVTAGPDSPMAMTISQGRPPFDVESAGPFGRRMSLHHDARAAGDRAPLLAAAAEPVTTVTIAPTPAPGEDGKTDKAKAKAKAKAAEGEGEVQEELPPTDFVRKFWDPCIWRSLADISYDAAIRDASGGTSTPPSRSLEGERWRRLELLVAPDAPLSARLFAPWPTSADLAADLPKAESAGLLGARSPSLRRIGVGTGAFPADDPEAAKEEVRMLDAGLATIEKKVSDLGNADGLAVMNDLRLVHRFRQEWLAVRAREALTRRHPKRALAYLELARDHATASVGPENSPAIYALLAEARLALGRTREALDALHVLAAAHPEVLGLVEVTGDLAVLQGLDRQGDSKEE
jgi:hypothetical protein